MSASVCVNGFGETAVTTVRPSLRDSTPVTTYPSGTVACAGKDVGRSTGLASLAQTTAADVALEPGAAIAASISSAPHPPRAAEAPSASAARSTARGAAPRVGLLTGSPASADGCRTRPT